MLVVCFVGSRIGRGSDASHYSDVQRAMACDGTHDGFHDQMVGHAQCENVLEAMLHAPHLLTMLVCADEMSSGVSVSADARHSAKLVEMFSAGRHTAQGGMGDNMAGTA